MGRSAITIGLSFLAILIARKSFSLTLSAAAAAGEGEAECVGFARASKPKRSALRACAGNFNSIDKMKGGETR
jgi:hypothetical protein